MDYKNFEFRHGGAVIVHTRETYHATRHGWSVKPDAVTVKPVTVEFYNNFVRSSDFFESRVKWGATDCGRLPVELVTVSWDGSTKHIDRFRITIGGEGANN